MNQGHKLQHRLINSEKRSLMPQVRGFHGDLDSFLQFRKILTETPLLGQFSIFHYLDKHRKGFCHSSLI